VIRDLKTKGEIIVHSKIQGFEVTVTAEDGRTHLRVSFGTSGELILDTKALSIRGLENMATVFERAAKMAYTELDYYWRKKHEMSRTSRNHDAP
jgi:hypothetical protein